MTSPLAWGRPDLVDRARTLADKAPDAPVPETLRLLDELGHIAQIDWEAFLPLPLPVLAVLPAAEAPTDGGPDPA
jgi:hypothetical protein